MVSDLRRAHNPRPLCLQSLALPQLLLPLLLLALALLCALPDRNSIALLAFPLCSLVSVPLAVR